MKKLLKIVTLPVLEPKLSKSEKADVDVTDDEEVAVFYLTAASKDEVVDDSEDKNLILSAADHLRIGCGSASRSLF